MNENRIRAALREVSGLSDSPDSEKHGDAARKGQQEDPGVVSSSPAVTAISLLPPAYIPPSKELLTTQNSAQHMLPRHENKMCWSISFRAPPLFLPSHLIVEILLHYTSLFCTKATKVEHRVHCLAMEGYFSKKHFFL